MDLVQNGGGEVSAKIHEHYFFKIKYKKCETLHNSVIDSVCVQWTQIYSILEMHGSMHLFSTTCDGQGHPLQKVPFVNPC